MVKSVNIRIFDQETAPELDAAVISVGSDENIIYAKSIAVQVLLIIGFDYSYFQ